MAGAVATLWIDNPPVNAISSEVAAALGSELAALDPATRLVLLRGRGERAFSAGADVNSFRAGSGPPAGLQPLADAIEAYPAPVVAAIHGHCLGGGLEVALACDLRIAHTAATLGQPEVTLGLIPGGGGTQRLPRLIGPGRAAWLMLSGERIDAVQAEAWGLVELVVDDLEAGIERVSTAITKGSPNAQRELKRLLRITREERSDRAELEAFDRCLESDDWREGLAAFRERRAPSFG